MIYVRKSNEKTTTQSQYKEFNIEILKSEKKLQQMSNDNKKIIVCKDYYNA